MRYSMHGKLARDESEFEQDFPIYDGVVPGKQQSTMSLPVSTTQSGRVDNAVSEKNSAGASSSAQASSRRELDTWTKAAVRPDLHVSRESAEGTQERWPGAQYLAGPFASETVGARRPERREDVFYGAQNDNTWVEDRNEQTGASISYPSRAEAEERQTYLQSLGEWENFEVRARKDGNASEFAVFMRGKRTINNFIKLIKKAEAAYPQLTTNQILDGLRALAGYNDKRWQKMLGKKSLAEPIKPVKDKLTQGDIDALRAMLAHSGTDECDEKGIVKDNGGDYVAMGHVLTGISAGLNRDRNTELADGFLEKTGRVVGVGEQVDNLYAATIAGDLGQSAIMGNQRKRSKKLVGPGTEATDAELYGDIDGFNIGAPQDFWSRMERGDIVPERLSTMLLEYYNAVEKDEKAHRFERFKDDGMPGLQGEIDRFATNYAYKHRGKWDGLWSDTESASKAVYQQFDAWLKSEMKSPDKPVQSGVGKGVIKDGAESVWLVRNPSKYRSTRSAALTAGVKLQILDRGAAEPFNEPLADQQAFGWTNVMVVDGASEGAIGWIMNKFITEE